MKVLLECKVDSRTYIARERQIRYDDKVYTFIPNDEGFISRLSILMDIQHPERFCSDVDPNELHKASKEVSDFLIKEMRELESLLAFTHHLRKISWNDPEFRLFTEDAEKGKVSFTRTYGLRQYRDEAKSANEESLRGLLDFRPRLGHLVVPMAFYREGLNDYRSGRYINAFVNFFFILEGFYLDGVHGGKAFHKFKSSPEFLRFVDWIISTAIHTDPERHYHLREMLNHKPEDKRLVWSDTLVELLVKTRNELSHFQDNPKKLQGTPFNQGRFEAVAFVALGLASRVLLQRMADVGVSMNEEPWTEPTN